MSWPFFFAIAGTLALIALYTDFILPENTKSNMRKKVDQYFDRLESLNFEEILKSEVRAFSLRLDHYFGKSLISARSFFISLLLSIFFIDYVMAVGGNDLDFSYIQALDISTYLSFKHRGENLYLAVFPLVLVNVITDYCSIILTRIFTKKMANSESATGIFYIFVYDIVAATFILFICTNIGWIVYKVIAYGSFDSYLQYVLAPVFILLGITALLPTFIHIFVVSFVFLMRLLAKPIHWLAQRTLYQVAVSDKPLVSLVTGALTSIVAVINLWVKAL